MGKKKGDSKGGKVPVCECQHPFNCDCGLRPPRPSRGHKWDPEAKVWGGKGHKQKGGVGGAVVASAATVTEKGKTTLAQWMRLPHQLLDEFCKKEKRPPPKFNSLDNQGSKFKYRVIVQDSKVSKRGGEHDFIFIPKVAVENEEQAKEEAALLALLSLTPNIPHERKLPEPYKTTWLNAISATKSNDSQPKESIKEQEQSSENTPKVGHGSAATASSSLVNARSYSSISDKRKQDEEKRKEKMAKIRKHEAIRMANRDMLVFMSAKMRQHIETLLRGDADADLLSALVSEDDSLLDQEDYGDDDVVKSYVIDRLTHEGFTVKQARTGYTAAMKNSSSSIVTLKMENEDEYMDKCYEESLQWLCVHLDEENLPEGFDPRGRSLEVISTKTKAQTNSSMDPIIMDEKIKNLSKKFGVSQYEAMCLLKENLVPRTALFNSILKFNKMSGDDFGSTHTLSDHEQEQNIQKSLEEEEVLKAMFPLEEDLQIKSLSEDTKEIQISLPATDGIKKKLVIEYPVASYPSVYPKIFITGGWDIFKEGSGTAVHLLLYQFMMTLSLHEPMVFDIFNYVQELLQSIDDDSISLSISSGVESHLLPFLDGGKEFLKHMSSKVKVRNNTAVGEVRHSSKTSTLSINQVKVKQRSRARSAFWRVPPNQTRPANPNPDISTSMQKARKSLPAAAAKDEFLRVMEEADKHNKVLLVTGETGCGKVSQFNLQRIISCVPYLTKYLFKTTQIPQFILESAPDRVKIVVAQPRRLAATGVADRVSDERGEKEVGNQGSVGYVVRGGSNLGDNTRLMFCTTGVLLRQLQSEGALDCITHIVIDEVHERNLDTDILLAILKETKPPHLRVILMSATMDADRFASYWGSHTPRMHIPGRTFPVQDFTLEDALEITGYVPPKKGKKKSFHSSRGNEKKSPWVDSEHSDDDGSDGEGEKEMGSDCVQDNQSMSSTSSTNQSKVIIPVEELVKRIPTSLIDYDLIARLVHKLINTKKADDNGSILVFLPGVGEISQAEKAILQITGGNGMKVLPLHGGLQPNEQKKVFEEFYGVTKVILSTNVAETSITIPDCTMVIDTCKEKQSSYDPSNRMPLLVEKLASKDSLQQRRGRAGRVRSGICYKLISRETLSNLPEHGEPEIKRCALDQTFLSLLFLGVEEGSGNFLSTLLDPPSQTAIDAAISSLESIGAVNSIDSHGTKNVVLTPLGLHLAGIPAPPLIGKLLIMGSLLGCRSAALAIAGALSTGRSPFLRIDSPRGIQRDDSSMNNDMKTRSILDERVAILESVGNSDHAMFAAIYMKWNSIDGGGGAKKRFCESLGLSQVGMRDIHQLVRQLDASLSEAGFKSTADSDENIKSWRIIKSCIVSALAPSQLVRVFRSSTKYAETVEGAIEKDAEAKELKFFTRRHTNDDSSCDLKSYYHNIPEEQVFVHPSSFNFSTGSYTCPWVVFYQLIRTSKPFLRDITECSKYDILLFGGSIQVLAADGKIIVDNYVHISANARIGALIGGLRRKIDHLLEKKISDPSFEIANAVEMKLIVKLLKTDGMGGR